MAASNPTDHRHPDPDSPAAEDRLVESAVLAFVLDQHPAHLILPELALALSHRSGDFSAEDAVERSVRELVGAGLLHIAGGLVVPTRATLYFAALELD